MSSSYVVVVEDVTEYLFSHAQLRSFIASRIASILERCMRYVTIAMDFRTKVWSWSLYSHFLIHSTYRIIKPREMKIVLEFEIGRNCHFRRWHPSAQCLWTERWVSSSKRMKQHRKSQEGLKLPFAATHNGTVPLLSTSWVREYFIRALEYYDLH